MSSRPDGPSPFQLRKLVEEMMRYESTLADMLAQLGEPRAISATQVTEARAARRAWREEPPQQPA
jgi:hypothetical protein